MILLTEVNNLYTKLYEYKIISKKIDFTELDKITEKVYDSYGKNLDKIKLKKLNGEQREEILAQINKIKNIVLKERM